MWNQGCFNHLVELTYEKIGKLLDKFARMNSNNGARNNIEQGRMHDSISRMWGEASFTCFLTCKPPESKPGPTDWPIVTYMSLVHAAKNQRETKVLLSLIC